MAIAIHRPYPGVALLVTEQGSVLLGAPADAFKATKQYCNQHQLPFPRVLVAPQRLVAEANPQFAPEFFLYDFLFVYGAAFKPQLEAERLQLVVDKEQVHEERAALGITLTGPSRADLASFKDAKGQACLTPRDVKLLADVSEHMAIKKGDRPRTLDEMIETPTFDGSGSIDVLGGHMRLQRTGPSSFRAKVGGAVEEIDLSFKPPVVPFALLPKPTQAQTPLTFGIKALGTRSGFDLSGPTTGFLLWINGRAIIYDGPVGTRYLLERQGIAFSDVEAVVLSHCHEDHMGAFVELILAGHKPKVYTAEPVYRSLLVKLAHHFRLREEQVAAFVDYHRVTPGQSLETLGATLDFFYTVHAIPTIGMAATVRTGGRTHRVQISGDTMHHDGLDKMRAAGVIDEETFVKMRHLIPDAKVDDAVYLADVGEAIIHGHPKDWQGNPNHVMYYHCPENDHTRSFGHIIAEPGKLYPLVEAPTIHPATPGRLLHALAFLELSDPTWLSTILFRGRTRKAEAGEVLIQAGQAHAASAFSVIVSGTATVQRPGGDTLTHLRAGEFFGLIELADKAGRHGATIVAETPMELFDIDAGLFNEYVTAAGKQDTLQRLWTQRPMVESAQIFRSLDQSVRNQIAALGLEERYRGGQSIFDQGLVGDDFYLLVEGKVSVEIDGKEVREIQHSDEDAFFGEIAALFPNRPRSATIRAKNAVRTLKVRGKDLRRLFEGEMGVRYALVVAIQERGDKKIELR